MKQDILTAVVAAIFGVIASYILTGLFIPELESTEFKTLNSNTTYNIVEPNPEVFNYRAINPTVEVYVGQCKEYSISGECIEDSTQGGNTTPTGPEETPEENPEETPEESPEENPTETPSETPEEAPTTPPEEQTPGEGTDNGPTD
jgi:hypothetical protein